MSKGIIYVMSTVVSGLVKIGKTGVSNFDSRMNILENNGYQNVTGLKRRFAIEVDSYHDKEELLHEIFSKSRVGNTELFSTDIDIIIQLLSSFEGKQIYPKFEEKEEIFREAHKEFEEKNDNLRVPKGFYYLNRERKDFGMINAKMKVENGVFTVLAGSDVCPAKEIYYIEIQEKARIENNILLENIEFSSPSMAGALVIGGSNNGWDSWKNEDGQSLDIYRKR